MSTPGYSQQIQQLHELYGQLTGQKLSLRFDRERLWFEFLHAGFTGDDLIQVVRYLQKEIRQTRRNVGALKLSNLLQLDRFEEDLNISRVRLRAQTPTSSNLPSGCTPLQQEQGRRQALEQLRRLKQQLGLTRDSGATRPHETSTLHPGKAPAG